MQCHCNIVGATGFEGNQHPAQSLELPLGSCAHRSQTPPRASQFGQSAPATSTGSTAYKLRRRLLGKIAPMPHQSLRGLVGFLTLPPVPIAAQVEAQCYPGGYPKPGKPRRQAAVVIPAVVRLRFGSPENACETLVTAVLTSGRAAPAEEHECTSCQRIWQASLHNDGRFKCLPQHLVPD
jgi:hypothetical protein